MTLNLPDRVFGRIEFERDGCLLLATDSGLMWIEPQRVEPHVADTVRVTGRIIPPGHVRREAMARAA